MNEVEAVARALAKANRIEICESAQYAFSSFREPALAAIAVIAADRAGLVAEIERLREAVGILEDGLQEVGDDYPGSSCQEWCQHQIKQARAALKDTRNDADA